MDWTSRHPPGNPPSEADIAGFIASPLWDALNQFLQESYGVEPTCRYSGCSAQPGWNVKYQKAGRSLCTLYPMPGYFIALVVIGAREQGEAQLLMPTLGPYTRSLFSDSWSGAMGQWLMVEVTDQAILEDVKQLIQLRRRIK